MACDCLDEMQKAGAENNTQLVTTHYFATVEQPHYQTPTLETEKIAPRNRKSVRFAVTFCPFCGTRYVPAAEEIAA
jgi:hypothetical protein